MIEGAEGDKSIYNTELKKKYIIVELERILKFY